MPCSCPGRCLTGMRALSRWPWAAWKLVGQDLVGGAGGVGLPAAVLRRPARRRPGRGRWRDGSGRGQSGRGRSKRRAAAWRRRWRSPGAPRPVRPRGWLTSVVATARPDSAWARAVWEGARGPRRSGAARDKGNTRTRPERGIPGYVGDSTTRGSRTQTKPTTNGPNRKKEAGKEEKRNEERRRKGDNR